MDIDKIRTALLTPRIISITIGIAAIVAAVFIDRIRSFVALVPTLLTWPITLLVVVVYLGSSPTATTRLSRLIGRFRSVKLLGSEVTFTSEGARQLLSDAEGAFEDFRRQAEHEIKRQVQAQDLYGKMGRVFLDGNLGDLSGTSRCTVHIEDILFKDTLYQLLEYYPKRAGDGLAGRRFSVRFGMLGLTWRMEKHEGQSCAPATTEDELIRNWGFKRDEATDKSRQRPSYLCVLLREEKGSPIGILFLDSTEENAFGTTSEELQSRADTVALLCQETGFQDGLANVVNTLRAYRAGIQIHG